VKLRPASPSLDAFLDDRVQSADYDLAVRLHQLFGRLEDGTVALFTGRWGTGKTTFIKRWLRYLEHHNQPAVYIDAFSVDFIESPFVAITGAISEAVVAKGKSDDPRYKQFTQAAAKVGKSFAPTLTKIGIKAATFGLIGTAELDALERAAESAAADVADHVSAAIEDAIAEHAKNNSRIATLRERLSEIPGALKSEADSDDTTDQPTLIVIVDELDRCKPDFALGVLETIKHFFGAPRVHFVLCTNRDHLELSVKHKYGSFDAAREYLEKFFDFEIHFDQNYELGFSSVLVHIETLSSDIPTDDRRKEEIRRFVSAIATAHRLTFRQVESVFLNIKLAYSSIGKQEYNPTILIVFLVCLKILRPDLYVQAKRGSLDHQIFIESLIPDGNWGDLNTDRLRLLFKFYLLEEIDERSEEWRDFGSEEWRFNLSRKKVIPYLCNSIIDRFSSR
jgi:hypothetical protein